MPFSHWEKTIEDSHTILSPLRNRPVNPLMYGGIKASSRPATQFIPSTFRDSTCQDININNNNNMDLFCALIQKTATNQGTYTNK